MSKNRTEQHCWTTLIKTKARFLILSFGMWVTEFSSSAWNKALNNSKQIFLIQYWILQTSLLLQNTEHHYTGMTTAHWHAVMKFDCCTVKHSYWCFSWWVKCFTAEEYMCQTSANCRSLCFKEQYASLRNQRQLMPDLELRNPVLWQQQPHHQATFKEAPVSCSVKLSITCKLVFICFSENFQFTTEN